MLFSYFLWYGNVNNLELKTGRCICLWLLCFLFYSHASSTEVILNFKANCCLTKKCFYLALNLFSDISPGCGIWDFLFWCCLGSTRRIYGTLSVFCLMLILWRKWNSRTPHFWECGKVDDSVGIIGDYNFVWLVSCMTSYK